MALRAAETKGDDAGDRRRVATIERLFQLEGGVAKQGFERRMRLALDNAADQFGGTGETVRTAKAGKLEGILPGDGHVAGSRTRACS